MATERVFHFEVETRAFAPDEIVLAAIRPLLGWYTVRRFRTVGVAPVPEFAVDRYWAVCGGFSEANHRDTSWPAERSRDWD